MKLVIAIVQNERQRRAQGRAAQFTAMRRLSLARPAAFLREGNTTIMIGVDQSRLENLLGLIKTSCTTRTQFVNPACRR